MLRIVFWRLFFGQKPEEFPDGSELRCEFRHKLSGKDHKVSIFNMETGLPKQGRCFECHFESFRDKQEGIFERP